MSATTNEAQQADSLIGVRDCGCITAWMSLEHSTKREVKEFYGEMASSGREVRGQIGECTHKPGARR